MMAAMAPDATVDVYDGPNGGTGPLDTYATMVNQDAVSVISTSWGQCEAQTAPVVVEAESELFEQAVGQGQTIAAAAGDEGSEDCYFFPSSTDTRLEVDDPASQPWVTSVGATDLSALGPAPTESVWNAGLFEGTGGGGVSATWTLPSWQVGPGVQNPYTKARDSFTGPRPVPTSSGGATCRVARCPTSPSDGDPGTGFASYCRATRGGQDRRHELARPCGGRWPRWPTRSPRRRVGFMNPALYQAQCQAHLAFNDVTDGEQPAGRLRPERPALQPRRPVLPGHAGLRPGHRARDPRRPHLVRASAPHPGDAAPR